MAMTFTNGAQFLFCNSALVVLIVLRFLGPHNIYTAGVVLDLSVEESLEQFQDNKLAIVCNNLNFKPTNKYVACHDDRLLGCGWGTLIAYAAKNWGSEATGATLAKKRPKFITDRIVENSVNFSIYQLCQLRTELCFIGLCG